MLLNVFSCSEDRVRGWVAEGNRARKKYSQYSVLRSPLTSAKLDDHNVKWVWKVWEMIPPMSQSCWVFVIQPSNTHVGQTINPS